MIKFGKGVVKCRFLILILAFLLLIPSAIGYLKTRINYDILSYLPGEIETMKGQDILLDEFGTGAFSFVRVWMTKICKKLQMKLRMCRM